MGPGTGFVGDSPRRCATRRHLDALEVSLHDSELHEEVERTALLMVAANESEGRLPQRVVDEILGVVPPQRPAPRHPEFGAGLLSSTTFSFRRR